MRRVLLALLVALALSGGLEAQTAPRVFWEHDGLNLTTFKCQIDSETAVDLTGLYTLDSGTTYYTALSNCGWASAAVGSHLLYIYACNGDSCTTSTGIYVVKL